MRSVLAAALALAAGLLLPAGLAGADEPTITAARYTDPTDKYTHAVLGDGIEHMGFEVTLSTGAKSKILWRDTIVFEDTEPRLIDMDNDGQPEVMVVETHMDRGARIAFYRINDSKLEPAGNIPFIGTRFRWLAPIGASDLDGDGHIEFAYIDRPHLAKTLRVWRYIRDDDATVRLEPVAEQPGLTNHRIGESDIAGFIRTCNGLSEIITANANWTQVMATRLEGTSLTTRPIGPHADRSSFASHAICP